MCVSAATAAAAATATAAAVEVCLRLSQVSLLLLFVLSAWCRNKRQKLLPAHDTAAGAAGAAPVRTLTSL